MYVCMRLLTWFNKHVSSIIHAIASLLSFCTAEAEVKSPSSDGGEKEEKKPDQTETSSEEKPST